MQRTCWLLVLWSGYVTLSAAAQSPPVASPPRLRDYLHTAASLLDAYVTEQDNWNHYFTTVAPDQSAREQITPQQKYRRFLTDTLTQWRQIATVPPTCQSAHFLYELALYAYVAAADFRQVFLYARSSLLGSKKVAMLAAERSRHYTAEGDAYFKKAALLAPSHGCAGSSK